MAMAEQKLRILLVEDSRSEAAIVKALLAQVDGGKLEVHNVRTFADAELALRLKKHDAVLLDQMLPDMPGTQVGAKLSAMMQDNLMPPVPVVALSAAGVLQGRGAWQHTQVLTIMAKPLASEAVQQLCRRMLPPDGSFFNSTASAAGRELQASLGHKSTMLRAQMYEYLAAFCAAAADTALSPTDISQRAHAVKSAALTLGYERLAACLGAVEHAVMSGDRQFMRDNLPVIIYYLQCAVVQAQNPAQRVALSS